MRRATTIAAAIAVMASAAACGGATASTAATAAQAAPAAEGRELPLPAVPAELTRPADRADFVAARFWQGLDFASARAADTTFMEQNFVNFLSVLPHASSDSVRAAAVAALLARASTAPAALSLIGWLAEVYLNSTDSPMYSEGAYIDFLRTMAVSEAVEPAMRERYAAQLADMAVNRPGDRAADFPYEAADGSSATLLQLAAAHDSTLMVLYDPDCRDCHVLIDSLSRDADMRRAVASGAMAVVAMYPYGDTDLWRATVAELPQWWTAARALRPIDDDGTYYIPRTPRTYLLDRSGRIVSLRE